MDGSSLNICLLSIDVDDPFGSGRLFKEKCWDPILLILGTQNNRAWDELANDIKAGGNNNAIVISPPPDDRPASFENRVICNTVCVHSKRAAWSMDPALLTVSLTHP